MLIFYFVFIQVDKYIRYYNLFIFNKIKLYLKKIMNMKYLCVYFYF